MGMAASQGHRGRGVGSRIGVHTVDTHARMTMVGIRVSPDVGVVVGVAHRGGDSGRHTRNDDNGRDTEVTRCGGSGDGERVQVDGWKAVRSLTAWRSHG